MLSELILPRWVIPVEPAGTVLSDHAVLVRDGLIEAVLPAAEARRRYGAVPVTALPDHVLIPGLINLHTHAAMTLMRGIGDDLPLARWLRERIWPVEQAHMSADFVRAGTQLACLEMLQGGVTCFADMYFFPDAAAEAVAEIGMRACLGIVVIDFPTAWAADPQDYLTRGLAVRDNWRDEPLLSFALAPHAPYTVGDATFAQVATLSDQLGIPIHTHVHETGEEIAESERHFGVRPLERLARLGVVGPQLIAVHAVHLTPAEIALLAERGATVAHCPTSNLKLASGIAPIAALLSAGVNLGLGTDGAASNNRLDLFAEMRLAALLAKGASGAADAFPAHQVLHSATLGAATALGLERRIGSISAGKEADLCAVDLGGLSSQPCFDPAGHVIFVAGREHVSHVWVRGRPVVQKRQFTESTAERASIAGASALSVWQNRIGFPFARQH